MEEPDPQPTKEDVIPQKDISESKSIDDVECISADDLKITSTVESLDISSIENVTDHPTSPLKPLLPQPSLKQMVPQSLTPPPLPLLLHPSQPDLLVIDDKKMLEVNDQKEGKINVDQHHENMEVDKSHDQEDSMSALDDLNNDMTDTLYTIEDLNDSHNEETKDSNDGDGEQKVIRAKLINTTELGCCEYCGGPVKKRRICSSLKKFCSKACARNCRKPKQREDESNGDAPTEDVTGSTAAATIISGEGEHKMTWDDYLQAASSKAAPDLCFKHVTSDVPGLKPGMKLEAVDRNNPPSYCVATVIKCVGHRVCIRYDGYGSDNTNDMWCNYQAEELHPIGWCAQNGYPLQPPKGVNSSLEAWRTFLTQTLTGALAAPQDLFKKSQEHFQPRVHGFEVGMKLEAIHPLRPSIICPATITKSLGPYYFAVTPDYQYDLPPTTFCCHSDSPGIFPIGWCYRNGIELTYPANYSKKTFSWPKYLSMCMATAAPSHLFKKVKAHKFRVGMKVEAVDLEQPAVICVATITNVIGKLLFLFFDGQSRFQFVDVESPDIYPIGWCKRTGHPLVTPFGVMPSNYDSKTKVAETEILYLPSFDEVMGRQVSTLPTSTVAILPKKSSSRTEQDKEKDKEKEKDDQKGDMESEEKSGDSDISEDDCLASERFYHNKNQIFFNKGCCIGPLLNPDEVKLLPDATPPGKVSTVIRTGLEMVAQAALDPEKVIDLMQEGCGVRVTIKHKGKLLKKAISRVDSRPKLERYLKRFCRRLICCEYFLSLKPVGQPCPDQCKSDDQGNLQGPKGLKAKRSREYFEVKHLGFEKKKRGRRRRKTEILGLGPSTQGVPMKTVSSENGTPLPATSGLPSSTRNRQLAPAYHIQPNGSALNRPAVATAALPGVQAPVVRYQGPGNVAVVRPNTNLQLPVRSHGNQAAIAPAQPSQIVIGSIHANSPIVKQDGVLATGRTLIMTDVSVAQGSTKPRIVTNVSGQRFATSSSGGGTTITFGRAPPNVTVSPSLTPPPLTRISDTVESISADLTPSPKSTVSGFSLSPSSHGSRGPPNVVVSSMGQVMAAQGGTTSEALTSHFTTGSTPVGGVIRAPIVIPPQVKQDTPPPPPLVHASKVSSGSRMIAPAGSVISSSKVSIVPSSFSQVQSFSRPFSNSNGHQTLYKPASNSMKSQSTSSRTAYIRPGSVKGDISTVHKHIMPSYVTQRISPKPPSMSQSNDSSKVPIVRHQQVFQPIGQSTRPIIAAKKQGVVQTIHHNPSPSQVNSSTFHSTASNVVKPSHVQSVTLNKVRAGIKSKAIHYQPSNNDLRIIKQEKDAEQHYGNVDPVKDQGQLADNYGDAQKNKRNLWWLKKKRRKRSRLTYMRAKCRKREDGSEAMSDEYCLSDDGEIEDPAMLEEYVDYADRPKRGRISELNDFVMRLEEEEVLAMADEEDPDWDESMEGKKVKQQVKPKRKGFGRPRKDGGSEVSSPTLSNPPSPLLLSQSTANNSSFIRRPPNSKPQPSDAQVLKLEPPPSRRHLSVSVDHEDGMAYKGKQARSASFPTEDGYAKQPIRSTSSITSPLSPKSPPFKRRRLVDVGVNTSLPGCLNGRSPDLPSNPLSWSVDNVIQYIRSTDCGHYAVIFKEEEIDGQALLMLSRDALMQFTPMKLGPTLKMCSYISQLRLRAK